MKNGTPLCLRIYALTKMELALITVHGGVPLLKNFYGLLNPVMPCSVLITLPSFEQITWFNMFNKMMICDC